MIILLDLTDYEDTKLVLLTIKHDLEILIPRTYEEAINNPNYG